MVLKTKALIYIALLIMPFVMLNCKQQTKQSGSETAQVQAAADDAVKIYYFHGRMRCATCIAIQEAAQQTYKEHFTGNDNVTFHEIDFSDRANSALADKYEIAFSSLIIAKGEEHVDITELAFYNVMNKPDLLRQAIKENTEKFLIN